jgi:Tfp pilus assembly protein PilF
VAARRAVELGPNFAFAWTHLAELEFGFGENERALQALQTSLRLAPRNAQSLALQGFLLAARNKTDQAIVAFEEAILTDGALANAWLGRGLCRIRKGQTLSGRDDLLVAATLEPQRSLLRSYLGKAFDQSGDPVRALAELEAAHELDDADPTPWLYSALIKQQQNRINEAVKELETSEALNDNRRFYRSRHLLDQDRAVRGANLATVYQDANMSEVSLREAARAVNADYANYSAHLFLGESYDALRDPHQFNLRYETPWLSEYLVANLLAPVTAGTLSPYVTQQEYGRLFERDRIGLASTTEYWSRGDWVQNAVQYGYLGNTSYALEVAYRSENGSRPNNDLEELTATIKLKEQLRPQDSLFFQGTYFDADSGDLAQYYSKTNAHHGLRVEENQEPLLLAGWHHEWSPTSHTLLLGGYWQDRLEMTDPAQSVVLLRRGAAGQVNGVPFPQLPTAQSDYRSEFDAYSTELQQIFSPAPCTIVCGVRFQTGSFDTRGTLGASTPTAFAVGGAVDPGFFSSPPVQRHFKTDFQRLTFYGYDYWQIVDSLLVTAGLSYDQLHFPDNFRYSPIEEGDDQTDLVAPKVGLIWSPWPRTTVRAAYSQSLGGVSFDQSFQLEPSQVAGFNQAYRSLIPESVVGALSGAKFETRAVSLEQKIGAGTYLGAQAEWLRSKAERTLGTIDLVGLFPEVYEVANTEESFDYDERTLLLTVNQLVGKCWSLGARYRLSEADLESRFEEIPKSVSSAARTDLTATLHQVNLFVLFNHYTGFYGQLDSIWSHQANSGYEPELPGDDFWQFNVAGGIRLWRRRLDARLSLLNVTSQDYQLNPLNLTPDLPRSRTLVASLRFYF